MKKYRVKNHNHKSEYIEILKETEDGFLIRYVRIKDGSEKVTEEIITRHLFNICLRTGYIHELDTSKSIA